MAKLLRILPALSLVVAFGGSNRAGAQQFDGSDRGSLGGARSVAQGPQNAPTASRDPSVSAASFEAAAPPGAADSPGQESGLRTPAMSFSNPSRNSAGRLLPPKPASAHRSKAAGASPESLTAEAGRLPSLLTVVGSTCVVLSLFLVIAWLMKKGLPQGMQSLPGDVVEVLGRAPLAKGQFVHLVRCGGKFLLVALTPTGASTLTEITDAAEVQRLSELCGKLPSSDAASFDRTLAGFGGEPSIESDADSQRRDTTRSAKVRFDPHTRLAETRHA